MCGTFVLCGPGVPVRRLPPMAASRPGPVLAISILAIIEAGVLLLSAGRAARSGGDLIERGVAVLPLLGAMLFVRAGFLVTIAALYVLFAWSALSGRSWAWPVGLIGAVMDAIAVLTLLAAEVAPLLFALRAIVPVIVLVYLIAPVGRRQLARRPPVPS